MTTSIEMDEPVRDRSVPLLVAAGLVVAVVVGAVTVFGIQRPPTLPRLADEPVPAPPGAVAWTTYRQEPCVDVAAPDGRVREVRCDRDAGELLGWGGPGQLRLSGWNGHQARVLVVDATTGEVVRTEDDPNGTAAQERWSRERVIRDHRSDGELVVEEPTGNEIWRVAAPDGYRLRSSTVSPDGRWVAAVDSAERLVLLSVDGSAPPRLWATGVDTYDQPFWEGTDGR